MNVHKKILQFVDKISHVIGNPYFVIALTILIVVWLLIGFPLGFSETWFQSIDIFIFTTSFIAIFIVQSTQNADTQAIQDKLDEILRSLPEANSKIIGEEKKLKSGNRKLK